MDPRAVKRRVGLLLAFTLARPASAAAEEERLSFGFEARGGRATAPYVTRAFPEVSGYGMSLEAFARWQLASQFWVRARAPYALMRIEQPAGALYEESAFGNPEIGVSVEQALPSLLVSTGRAGVDLGLALPFAEHDSLASQLEGRALTLANAFSGLSEPELYTPGVVALTPSAFATLKWSRVSLRGSLKQPVLVRVSRANLPSDTSVRSFGTTSVVELKAGVSPLSWLTLSFAPRLTLREVAVAHDGAGPATVLLSEGVDVVFSKSLRVGLSLHIPVASALRSTFAAGLHLQAGF